MLRREGYSGRITMLSADEALPCDRPKLSKDFLAGASDEAAIPLRSHGFYREHDIGLHLGASVTRLDTGSRRCSSRTAAATATMRCCWPQGRNPCSSTCAARTLPHVHTLRTPVDSRAIVAATAGSQRAVVIGSSFIGLEVASSLRARKVAVHVVTPDACPMGGRPGDRGGDLHPRAAREPRGHVPPRHDSDLD